MPPRGRRRATGCALVAVVVATVLLGPVPAGAAPVPPPAPVVDPVRDPAAGSEVLREQVDALAAQVAELDVRAEVAVEDHNEARSELDALVAQEVQAQVGMDDAGRALEADRAAAARRVRALYRTGGTAELAWTALATTGSGFSDAATGFVTARVLLDADAATVERARDRVDVAVASSARLQDLRRRRAVLEDEAALRQRAAEAALAAQQGLLAASGTALAEAVERERAEAERVALEQALAAAGRAAAERAALAAQQVRAGGPSAAELAAMSPEARAQALAQQSAGSAGPGGGLVTPGSVGSDQRAVLDRAVAAAPSAVAAAAIRAAGTRLGLPYTWGATGPGTFDCSGLTMWAYAQAGVRIPRTSRQQYAGLPRVPVEELQPGDLVFYADGAAPDTIHHVSIWLGDGLVLTAPRTGDVVKIAPVRRGPLYGAVRVPG